MLAPPRTHKVTIKGTSFTLAGMNFAIFRFTMVLKSIFFSRRPTLKCYFKDKNYIFGMNILIRVTCIDFQIRIRVGHGPVTCTRNLTFNPRGGQVSPCPLWAPMTSALAESLLL